MFRAETTRAIPDSLMLRVRPTKVKRLDSPDLVNDAGGRNRMVTSNCTARRRCTRRPGSVFIRPCRPKDLAERDARQSITLNLSWVAKMFRGQPLGCLLSQDAT